jgi:hypothetical protein
LTSFPIDRRHPGLRRKNGAQAALVVSRGPQSLFSSV